MLKSTPVFQYKHTIKNFIICITTLVMFVGGVFTDAQSTNTISNIVDGYVWQDSNANGLQDSGEIPLSNVTVNLVDSQSSIMASTTTTNDGRYEFTGIPYGEFTVQFGTIADHQLTLRDANGNSSNAIDSDVDSTTGLGALFTFAEYDRAFKTLQHYDMNEIITDPSTGCMGLSGTTLTDCTAQHQAMRYAGFRYSLQEASYPTTIEQNDSIQTVMKWFNIGFAPSYPTLGQNFSVHLYLVDTNGNVVLESSPSANIATWLPDTNGSQAPENIVLDTMLVTDTIPVGTYTLQVAIVDDLTSQPILIDPKTEGQMGRYVLDTINVIAESNGSTETIDAGYIPVAQPTPLSIDIDQSTLTIQADTTAMNTGYVNGIETNDYSLNASLGSVELLDDGSWMWLYSPTNNDAGEHTVILTAKDGADKTEEAQFTVSVQTSQPLNIPAFPGAEGFGAQSVGGRGGTVYEVTNLDNSGPGSLRACVEASGPRICVFRIGGTIELSETLRISEPYITIAGQTAPGGGITLKNDPRNTAQTILITTHDVILRYLRIRTGASIDPTCCNQALAITEGYNIIVDHISASWSTDQTITIFTDPKDKFIRDVTVQYSYITEALHVATNSDGGGHSTATIISSANNRNISFHHNLMAHNYARHPRISSVNPLDVVNNLIYNYGQELSFADPIYGALGVNYIGNLTLKGPNSSTNDPFIKLSTNTSHPMSIYVQGNIDDRYRTDNTLPEYLSVKDRSRGFMIPNRINTPTITIHSCESVSNCQVYDQVLYNAGSNAYVNEMGQFVFRQDAVDKRIVEEVNRREGKIIDATSASTMYNPVASVYLQPSDYTKYGINDPISPDGWPVLAAGTAPADQDHDGMPDVWEELYQFDPTDSSDNALDADNDGYTNLEEYLNGTNPGKGEESDGTIEPQPTEPLVINVDQNSVSTNEGGTAVNTGSLSGFQSKNFTVQASVGNVDVMTDGSWIWNHVTTDNVTNQQVTITAQDGNKTSQATFTYSATNLAPTALFSASATTVTTGSPVTLQFTNVNDAGQADINAGMTYHYDCTNDGATDITSGNPNATCTYNVAGQYTVAGRIQDKDGAFSDYTVNITVQQSQSAPPENPPADLVFSTDFENVVKTDNNHLNLPISHWFEFDGNGGADVWMETQNAHSGNRSLGMSLTDIQKSGRNEFDIMNMDELVGDEASVSVWMYFPEDYNQNVPGINWNWHEFLVLYSHDNPGAPLPYLRLIVSQPDITKKQFKLSLGGRDNIINANGSNGYSYGEVNPFDFPRGRWFNVHYYLKRDNTDGVVKVWIDGNLVFNINGVKTKEKTDYGYKMTIAKLYFETNEPKDQFIWVDDLNIYRGYVEPGGVTPQPTKPAPAPTTTPAPTQTPQDIPPRSTPTAPSIADYVAFGSEEVVAQNQTRIVNGSIGANSKVILNDLTKALDSQTIVIADQVVLRDNVTVPYAMYNKLIGSGNIAVSSVTSIKTPVLSNLPTMPAIMPGSENVTGNSNSTLTVDAGHYGVLFAKANSIIVLTGGVYHFSSVDLRKNAQLIVTAPTEIRVADKFKTVTGVFVGPQAGSGLDARHLVIYVNGINGTGGAKADAPKAFQTGTVNTINANVYTPNGTVKIGNDSNASGAFFGKWIIIGANSQISRTSVWGTIFDYSTFGTQAMMMQPSAVQLSAPQPEAQDTTLKIEPTEIVPTAEIVPTEEAPAVEIIETEAPVEPSPTSEIIPTEVQPTVEIVPTEMPTEVLPTVEIIPTEVIPTVEIIATEMPTEVVPEATQEPSG